MLRSGKKLRFTRGEADEFRKIGIDAAGVKTQADWEAAITQWADVLEAERPDLLDKIAHGPLRVKGLELPDP
jgi:hypothetical protein